MWRKHQVSTKSATFAVILHTERQTNYQPDRITLEEVKI